MRDLQEFKSVIKKPVVLAISQRKGGVGKTTCTLSLAKTYADAGYNVLVWDSDPQQSSTNILGVNSNIANDPMINMKNIATLSKEYREEVKSDYVLDDLFGYETEIEQSKSERTGLHDLISNIIEGYPLTKEDIDKAIITPTYEERSLRFENGKMSVSNVDSVSVSYGFDLLPASEELTDDELFLSSRDLGISKISIFKTIAEAIKVHKDYDVILIDCPPSLGLFSLNSIFASDGSILIGMPDKQSLHSLAKTKKNFRDLKQLDPNQKGILGFVLNACPNRNLVKPIMEHAVKEELGIKFFDTVIPQSVKAQQSSTSNAIFSDVDKKAKEAFINLAREIMQAYLDNEEWEAYRNSEYLKTYESIKANPELMDKLSNKAENIIKDELSERNISLEEFKKSSDKYERLFNSRLDKVINQYIVDEYEKGNLWERRRNKAYFEEDTNIEKK